MRDGPETALYATLLREYPSRAFCRMFEVPYGRKRIDFVAVPRLNSDLWVVAVEFKVRDWKSALWQARLNRSVVHRSLVALNSEFLPREDSYGLFRRAGVGLVAVDPENQSVSMLLEPTDRPGRLSDDRVREIWRRRVI